MTNRQMAQSAVNSVTVGNPEPVADEAVLFLNDDGTYSVTDFFGEEVSGLTASQAIDIIVKNLEA